MKWIKKIYDWVIHWADTPYGVPALFILAFAESSFFPIPPDVLLIALCIGNTKKSLKFALVCTLGSAFGGMLGYTIGLGLWSSISKYFFMYIPGFTPVLFEKVRALYNEYNFWIVFTAGFTPIPYKVFTIAAGVCSINFSIFMIASVISRGARFFLVSVLLYYFGEKIKVWIEKYFNILSIIFVILLFAGFYILKYKFH